MGYSSDAFGILALNVEWHCVPIHTQSPIWHELVPVVHVIVHVPWQMKSDRFSLDQPGDEQAFSMLM